MNTWFGDPRTKDAERKSWEAEHAERRGRFVEARALYSEAADLFSQVAIGVAVDHPNTRTDLGIAAVACFARALRFDQAVVFAERLLAEPDALTDGGKRELGEMADDYKSRAAPHRMPARRAMRMRDRVRVPLKAAA